MDRSHVVFYVLYCTIRWETERDERRMVAYSLCTGDKKVGNEEEDNVMYSRIEYVASIILDTCFHWLFLFLATSISREVMSSNEAD